MTRERDTNNSISIRKPLFHLPKFATKPKKKENTKKKINTQTKVTKTTTIEMERMPTDGESNQNKSKSLPALDYKIKNTIFHRQKERQTLQTRK